MLSALKGDDRRARIEALVELESGTASIDAEVCRALVDLLADPSKAVHRRAAGALSRAAADPANREIIEQALDAEDEHTRWCAAFALARAGDDGDKVVRAAIDALGRNDGDVRWAAAEIVCAAVRRRPELEPLVRDTAAFARGDRRKMALYCLRDLGCNETEVYLDALDDADQGVRLAALSGLAKAPVLDAAGVERVIAVMERDPAPGVCRAAGAALARFASDERVAQALGAARASSDPNVVRATRPRRVREDS